MSYALNLAPNGRVLSVTFDEYGAPGQPRVETLPEDGIDGYIFRNGEFVPDNHTIYAKVDDRNRVLEVRNETTLEQASFYVGGNPWKNCGEGHGWKYDEPESFCEDGLTDDRGVPLYKVSGRRIVPRTVEEVEADAHAEGLDITQEQRIAALEAALAEMVELLVDLLGGGE